MLSDTHSLPAPRLKVAAWLSAPARSIDPEVAAELRMSMFRRLETVLASAPLTVLLAILAMSRHPTFPFVVWVVLDLTVLCFRIAVVRHIIRRIKHRESTGLIAPWTTDLFIVAGTLWSAILGYGAFITISSSDASLVIMVLFVCTAVLAVQTIRNPSSPRMNRVQMGLILLPLSGGAWFSPLELVPWGTFLWPIYLVAMSNMSGQIHEDYVAMIIARFETRRHALHCALTKLPNRRFFDERLGAALRDTGAATYPSALLCIDLDGFKRINDDFGHPAGDALLIQVAGRLKDLARIDDMVARLGGDEFAILMWSCDRTCAESLAARINQTIAEPFLLGSNAVVQIGASVGIICLDCDATVMDPTVLMTRADQALYAAKHAGRGTFRRFEHRAFPGMSANAA